MIFQQDDDSREEGGVKKVEECLSVMPQTMTGDRRHSQVSLFIFFFYFYNTICNQVWYKYNILSMVIINSEG